MDEIHFNKYCCIHNSLKEIYFLRDSIAFLKKYIPNTKGIIIRIILSEKVIYDGFLNSFHCLWKYRNYQVDHLEMDKDGVYYLFIYK